MNNRKQPDRWESTMLAIVLAMAGTLFVFDKLSSLMQISIFSVHNIEHAAPLFLFVMAFSLMLADQTTVAASEGRAKAGHHERRN